MKVYIRIIILICDYYSALKGIEEMPVATCAQDVAMLPIK
jgi:hypothetical protein